MYRFKKQYQNESIAFNGRLVTKHNLTNDVALKMLKHPSLAQRIELIEEDVVIEEVVPVAPVARKKRRK